MEFRRNSVAVTFRLRRIRATSSNDMDILKRRVRRDTNVTATVVAVTFRLWRIEPMSFTLPHATFSTGKIAVT